MSVGLDVFLTVVLVMLSGTFSGLTLGYLSLDVQTLEVLSESEAPEAELAQKILPLRRRGNLILSTLVIANTAVNAALSITLTSFTSGLAGFLISTALIVFFGEIGPQAVCSRHSLRIGGFFIPLIYVMIFVLSPLAWPISKVLDWALGEEIPMTYDRKAFLKLVEMQDNEHTGLIKEEKNILKGALDFANRTVKEIMKPIGDCFVLNINQKLDFALMKDILLSGYSRIPVFDSDSAMSKCVGIIFVRDLILVDPEDAVSVSSILNIYGHEVLQVFPDTLLSEMLVLFKSGKTHLALVNDVDSSGEGDPVYVTQGLVTFEDILEVILRDNIHDEADVGSPVLDSTRLNMFNDSLFRQLSFPRLEGSEAIAAAHHLSASFSDFAAISHPILVDLIRSSRIVIVDQPMLQPNAQGVVRKTRSKKLLEVEKMSNYIENDGLCLYRSGEASEFCSLILDGRVVVKVGQEEFETQVGKFSVVGVEAVRSVHRSIDINDKLLQDDLKFPEFIPDFSAHVVSASCHVLRIHRRDYARAVLETYRGSRSQSTSLSENAQGSSSISENREPMVSADPDLRLEELPSGVREDMELTCLELEPRLELKECDSVSVPISSSHHHSDP
jgi:metal transporter CNNM